MGLSQADIIVQIGTIGLKIFLAYYTIISDFIYVWD